MPRSTFAPRSNNQSTQKKRALIVLTLLLIFVILPVTALAYVGFMPGLTPLMGTNKPVDLGVTYTAADFRSLQDKAQINVSNFDESPGTNQDIQQVSPGAQLVIYGANTKMATLSQQELTALVNMVPWTGTPLTNSQIRLSDGTFEFSGNIKSAYVSDLVKSLYPGSDYGQFAPALKLAGHLYNPAVYIKANISVTDNSNRPSHGQLALKILALKVNRTDLTKDVSGINTINVTIPEGSYEQGLAFSLSSLTAYSGKVDLYGTLPAHLSVGGGNADTICNNYHGGSIVSLNAVNGKIGSTIDACQ